MGNCFRDSAKEPGPTHGEAPPRSADGHGAYSTAAAAPPDSPGPRPGEGVRRLGALHPGGGCGAVAFVPGAPHQVVTGGEDGRLVLTDWAADQPVWGAEAHAKDINRAVVCPRRRLVLTASRDKDVKIFSLDTGVLQQTCGGHTLTVSALTVDPDETRCFSGARDNHVRLWDIETGRCLASNRTARNLVQNAKWIPGSSLVAQSSEDLYLRLWDVRTDALACAAALPALEYHAPGLDASEDGRYILTGHNGFVGQGSWAKLWDVRTLQCVQTFLGHQFTVSTALFLHGNRRGGRPLVITASNDGSVRIWDQSTGECLQTNPFPEGRITSMAVAPTVAEREPRGAADVALGFLSGMVALYALSDDLALTPLAQYGDPGGAVRPDAE